MAKRFTDTSIWKKQKWFRALNPIHKLLFLYIKDNCDHAGLWEIDAVQVMEDIGLDSVDLKGFIKGCNRDYDPFTGKEIERDRIRIIKEKTLWITGFVQFQYENKDSREVNPKGNFAKSAIAVLEANKLLNEAIDKGYVTLSEPLDTLTNPSARVKGKGRVKDNKDKEEEKTEKHPFDAFWNLYGKKKGREKCETKWNSLSEKEKQEIMEFLPIYNKSIEDEKFKKYPYTFLNSEIWKDDWDEYRVNQQSEAEKRIARRREITQWLS